MKENEAGEKVPVNYGRRYDLTVDEVRRFLWKKGREVTTEEAAVIYEWMCKMAAVAVTQYLRS